MKVVQRALISSGMSPGWHKRVALFGVIGSIAVAIFHAEVSALAIGIFLLFSSVGLLGEALSLGQRDELVVRRGLPRFPPVFLLVSRQEHPWRFFFHIAVYAVFGVLCSMIGAVVLAFSAFGVK